MAHLKITTPEGYGSATAVTGAMASVWLNGEDISHFVKRVSVTADAEGPISATLELWLGGIEIELPATVKELVLKEAKHVVRD